MDTVQDVLNEGLVLVNDPSGSKYTQDKTLPLVKKAYNDMTLAFLENGLPDTAAIDVIQTVPANSIIYPIPPSDLFTPIRMEEREAGSTDLFTPMEERDFEPNAIQSTNLRYWSWRKGAIRVGVSTLGANTPRDVRLYYRSLLPAIGVPTDSITILLAKGYLAARLAALIVMYIDENTTRASALQDDAQAILDKLVNLEVREMQSYPARRRMYRASRVR